MFGVLAAFLGGAARGASHQRWEEEHHGRPFGIEHCAKAANASKDRDPGWSAYWSGMAAGAIDESRSEERKSFTWFS